jgi:chromosome segregation ATPase
MYEMHLALFLKAGCDTMSLLTGLGQTTKMNLDDRKVFMVDLSLELVEKDL